jgi:hypothetical protein
VPHLHLPALFAGLPWPVRWALIGGGSLVSGFSGRLPAGAQDAGLYVGLAMLAYGVIATGWHHAAQWQVTQREAGKRGLDSWYFILASLFVAAVAIAGAGYGIGLRSAASKIAESPLGRPLLPGDRRPDPVLQIPNLSTQAAKEEFHGALREFSKITHQIDEIEKITMPIAENRPLVRSDLGGAAVPLEKVKQIRVLYSSVDSQIFAGGNAPFFNQYMLLYKRALVSIMPANSQPVWNNYNVALFHLELALLLVQSAEKHPEDRELYDRSVRSAEIFADQLRTPVSELHDWLAVINQRIDTMANSM